MQSRAGGSFVGDERQVRVVVMMVVCVGVRVMVCFRCNDVLLLHNTPLSSTSSFVSLSFYHHHASHFTAFAFQKRRTPKQVHWIPVLIP
jgi:hypothetical protein